MSCQGPSQKYSFVHLTTSVHLARDTNSYSSRCFETSTIYRIM